MGPDSASIEQLLNSNHPPSNQAAYEVGRLLLKPLKYLKDLDSEILELRNRLLELESKRNETQKHIFRYQLILAPIRRVPQDVLGEIFYHCLPTDRHPILKSTESPLLLTHVCSTWRTTAISTPKLWDRLYITFTDDDTLPNLERAAEMARNGYVAYGWRSAKPAVVKQRITQLMCRRYEAVKEWFLRSGSRPLSISLNFACAEWYNIPYSERPPGVTMELVSFLASLAPRWKEFDLKAPLSLYKALEDMLQVSQMTALTSIKVDQLGYHMSTTRPSYLKLLEAPNIRQIWMCGDYATIWSRAYQSFTKWNQLTDISCSGCLSDEETRFIFQHAPNLVHYQGIIMVNRAENIAILNDEPISMPYLRTLCITEYIHPRRQHYILHQIEAPKLQSVKYTSQFDEGAILTQAPMRFSARNPAPIPILPLLRKSTELASLSVRASHLRFWDLRTLLCAVPSITDLAIGDRATDRKTVLPMAILDYDDSGVLNTHLWTFNDLVVDNSFEVLEDGSDTLIPQLTTLIIASSTVQLSDGTLADLIKSRMLSKKAAVLKSVKVMLFRERERNIVEELTDYAESVGVQIDLDFDYAQKPDSIHIPTSPEFGLREDAGWS